ncbi:glycosyltransferase family 4 protein [Vibrio cholerae]|nr:glycosyltransferase family 4 protein [Vibrio cholerae]ELY5189371.1 glycosyltransferase family 4 protein [Vibrio cholerae]ELY5289298.1 glycosyltransferase family 4 protein [Vibrio cholerae]
MKVLHVHEKFWPYNGGSTTRLLNLIDTSNNKHYILARKHCDLLQSVQKLNNIIIIRYKSDFDLLKLIMCFFLNRKIDVFHIHNLRASFLFLPFLIFSRKCILELHSIYLPRSRIKKWISKFATYFYKNILLLSSRSKILFNDNFWGKPKITIIENGVSLSRFKFNRNLTGNLKICYVGSLKEFQGVDRFVEIANLIKRSDMEFHIYGGTASEIEELKQLDIEGKVQFHGQVQYSEVHHIYAQMDAMLMTRPKMKSTDSAIPIKPLEALSVGLDVFSTDVGGMRELDSILNTDKLKIMSNDELVDSLNVYQRTNKHQVVDLSYFDKITKTKQLEDIYKRL